MHCLKIFHLKHSFLSKIFLVLFNCQLFVLSRQHTTLLWIILCQLTQAGAIWKEWSSTAKLPPKDPSVGHFLFFFLCFFPNGVFIYLFVSLFWLFYSHIIYRITLSPSYNSSKSPYTSPLSQFHCSLLLPSEKGRLLTDINKTWHNNNQ